LSASLNLVLLSRNSIKLFFFFFFFFFLVKICFGKVAGSIHPFVFFFFSCLFAKKKEKKERKLVRKMKLQLVLILSILINVSLCTTLSRNATLSTLEPTQSWSIVAPKSKHVAYDWLAADVQLHEWSGSSCATVRIEIRAQTGRTVGESVHDEHEENLLTVCGNTTQSVPSVFRIVSPCTYGLTVSGGAEPIFIVEYTVLPFSPPASQVESDGDFSASVTVRAQFVKSCVAIGEPVTIGGDDGATPVVPTAFASSRVGDGNVTLALQCAQGSLTPTAALWASHNACPTRNSFDRSQFNVVLDANGAFSWAIADVPLGFVFFRGDLLASGECTLTLHANQPPPLATMADRDRDDDDDNVGLIVGLALGGACATVGAFIGGYALARHRARRNSYDAINL
jgi:hypothetical protein